MSIRGDISYENTLQGELNKKRNLNGNVRRSAYNELMAATEEAKKAAQEAQEAAKVIEGLIGTNLFPDSFELWNGDGAILSPAIGSPLIGSALEPKAVYRISITPGRTYKFTATPQGNETVGGGYAFFAVGDANGICLEFTYNSIDKYDVRSDYDGTVPAYIYYGVADNNNISDIEFREETFIEFGTIKVEQTSEGAIVTAIDKDGTTTAVIRNGKDGDKGDKGDQGIQGLPGKDGINGKDGLNGKDGANGTNGVPATHYWNGTTLTVTSASGTTSANLKGDKGDQGIQGEKGADGYTPVKGTDYFTPADKAEITQAVIAALPRYNGEVTTV